MNEYDTSDIDHLTEEYDMDEEQDLIHSYNNMDHEEPSLDPFSDVDLLQGLNDKQTEAVNHIDGPLLVLAGAGTGKTKVLTTRIANIVLSGKAYPSEILSVTFTNKAAKEMESRINELIGIQSSELWTGTFHSISAKILRRHASYLDFNPNFNIIDTDDQIRLVKQILNDMNIEDKLYPAKKFIYLISAWKDKGKSPNQVSSLPQINANDEFIGKAISIYEEYQKRLQALNAMDFGDLIMYVTKILDEYPDVLNYYNSKFKYILVDEYQDTNSVQYAWLRLLTQQQKNICCVGDDDQSIYGWRGAEVGNILRFEKDFKGSKVIKLEQNYRSTAQILELASTIISHNGARHKKTLWTESHEGAKINLISCFNDRSEAEAMANAIDNLKLRTSNYSNNAILVRASYQTREIEECMLRWRIPYNIIGGLKFYERKEIRDIISYIRVSVQHSDDLALQRIINIPKRGIGEKIMHKIYQHARLNVQSHFWAIKDLLENNEFSAKVQAVLTEFIDNLENWNRKFQDPTHHHKDIIKEIITKSNYIEYISKETNPEAREENLKEFISAVEEFPDITTFLEHISLISDTDTTNDEDTVSIMTLHASKGLEFDNVFLPGWEEGVFPSAKSIEDTVHNGLEEERRLAYVGITRAKKNLTILLASQRRMFQGVKPSIPSRFITELNRSNLNIINRGGFDINKLMKMKDMNDSITIDSLKSSPQNHQSFYQKRQKNTTYQLSKDNEKKSQQHMKKSSVSNLKKGQSISHKKFGTGQIRTIIGDISEVWFEKYGKKIVMNNTITVNSDNK